MSNKDYISFYSENKMWEKISEKATKRKLNEIF